MTNKPGRNPDHPVSRYVRYIIPAADLHRPADLADNYLVTPTTQGHIYIGVLLFREASSGMWIAQGLEHDISAHGPNVEAAKIAFERVVIGYLQLDERCHREPLSSLRPAPKPFWDAWQRVAQKQTETISATDPSIPPAYAIQAITDEVPTGT